MGLNIAVCVKPVPDPAQYHRIKLDLATKMLTRQGIPCVISNCDKTAMEKALKVKEECGGKVSIFSMAPLDSLDILRQGLAMGCDEIYLLSDKAFSGADTLATSYTLSKAIQKAGHYDMVFLGSASPDSATSHVPAQLGEWLGYSHVDSIDYFRLKGMTSATVRMRVETGYIEYDVQFPSVFSVRKELATPRLISFKNILNSRNKKVEIWGLQDINADLNKVGLDGSPTRVGKMYISDITRRGEKITGSLDDIADELIKRLYTAGVELLLEVQGDDK